MKKFEYLKTVNPTIQELNELGSIGWELVSIYKVIKSITYDLAIIYIFKREINE